MFVKKDVVLSALYSEQLAFPLLPSREPDLDDARDATSTNATIATNAALTHNVQLMTKPSSRRRNVSKETSPGTQGTRTMDMRVMDTQSGLVVVDQSLSCTV